MDLGYENLFSAGLCFAALAALSWAGDWRRRKRRNPDAVGWVNWTSLFFVSFMAACLLLLMALAVWRKG